jgi:hypothetical protein
LVWKELEHRAGIEPAYTGFADLRVSHFATDAHAVFGKTPSTEMISKTQNPTTLGAGGMPVVEIPVAESIPQNTPARCSADSSTDRMRE